jgi:hypothetical protein
MIESTMTFQYILIIALILTAGWSLQSHRRRHFGRTVFTLFAALLALVVAIRS